MKMDKPHVEVHPNSCHGERPILSGFAKGSVPRVCIFASKGFELGTQTVLQSLEGLLYTFPFRKGSLVAFLRIRIVFLVRYTM